jgi:hypothetical protein
LAHLFHIGFFKKKEALSKKGIIVFTGAVIGNEAILMIQGLSVMMMAGSPLYPWLLWAAAIFLLLGAFIVLLSAIQPIKRTEASHNPVLIRKTNKVLEIIN